MMSKYCDYPKCTVIFNMDECHVEECQFGNRQNVSSVIPGFVLIEMGVDAFGK